MSLQPSIPPPRGASGSVPARGGGRSRARAPPRAAAGPEQPTAVYSSQVGTATVLGSRTVVAIVGTTTVWAVPVVVVVVTSTGTGMNACGHSHGCKPLAVHVVTYYAEHWSLRSRSHGCNDSK